LDGEIDEAFQLASSDQVSRLIRDHATFNWHRAVILALWRSSTVRGFLWRSLAASGRRLIGHSVEKLGINGRGVAPRRGAERVNS